ncbi:MAG TPA: TonB-dependent receptor plug domain-containing protein, partial [Vicinamibacterales bacterium]|nr:TonB-dependent receptor plug domain-containing protein [Vicinamibacterales bacterium]
TRAMLQGFRTGVQTGIALEVAQQAGLSLVLKVGTTEETITVSGESALVETRSAALSAIVLGKTIEELPLNGRNYITLATLQPGIVQFTEKSGTAPATRGVQLNINGMGGRSNSFLMDGANIRGYAGLATVTAADTTLGVETIQEFRVVTNAFSADYGRAMGGVVSIATKSGSNEVHGSGFEFFRDSRMDTRNFFDVGAPPPFTRPTRENFLQARIDVELSDKDSLFVRHTYDGSHQIYPIATGTIQTTSLSQFSTKGTSDNHFFTVEEKRTVSPSLLNSARFSTSLLAYVQYPQNTLTTPLSFFPEAPFMGTIQIGGLGQLGNDNISPSNQNIDYWTWSDDVTYTKGKHLLKTGGLVEHSYADKLTTVNSRGLYTFPNLAQFLTGTPSRFQGVLPGGVLTRKRASTLSGFYVQDDYRVTASLTLNLGARYEFFTLPKDKDGLDAYLPDLLAPATVPGGPFVNPSLHNVSPRIGFAWDVGGNGRTSIRGGSGIYYDTDNPYASSLGFAIPSAPFAPSVNFTGAAIPFPTPVWPSSTNTSSLNLRMLDYHIKQPRGWTYNVNLQHELAANWAVTVGYAGSRGYHLVNSIEGNPVVPVKQADGTLFFPAGAPRRNPNWGSIDYRTSDGRSTYNSLQTGLNKRFSAGHQVQLSYTLSKTMDNGDAQLGMDIVNGSTYPQNPYNLDAEWAVAAFDSRHVFAANGTWELPAFRDNAALRGWQLNGVLTMHTGYPFSPSIQTINWSRAGSLGGGSEDRPNVKPGTDPRKIITGDPNHWFDTSVFELQPQGTFGNTPRNFLRGPGFANVDASLVKNQSLRGDTKLQFRLEVFNVLNRANFAVPTRPVFAGATQNEAPLATAGQVLRTANASRQVQLGIKVLF